MAGSYGARFKAIDDKLQELKCLPALVQQLSDKVAVFIQERESARQRNKDHTERRRPRTWAGEYQPPTRFIRMEFPRFQRSDVIGWIQECERYFELEGTPDNERVRLARKNLDEKGYIWDLAFMEEEGGRRVSWQKYKQALQVRFGPLNDERIPRTETMSNYGSLPRPLNGTRGVISASRNSETEKNLRPASGVVGSFSCEPESWTKVKSSSRGNGSSILDFGEPLQEKWHKEHSVLVLSPTASALPSSLSVQVEGESCVSAKETTLVSAPLTTASSLSTPMHILSSNRLPLSPTASTMSKTIVSDYSVPLSIDYVLGLGNIHQSTWQDQKFAWLKEGPFEKSNAQLESIINSKVQELRQKLEVQSEIFSGQLVPIFLFSDECMGFVFQELGPKLLLSWFLSNRPTRSFYIWVFLIVSVARCLVLSWFRGELIKMLYGSALHPLFPFGSEFSKRVVAGAAVLKTDIYQISSHSFQKSAKVQNLATSAYVLLYQFFGFIFVFCCLPSLRARMCLGREY